MRDFALDIIASILLFFEGLRDTLTDALRFLWRVTVWLAFVPFFGMAGTHFSGERELNWTSYNIHHRRILLQRMVGKTVFFYTIHNVGPVKYLRLLEDGDYRRLLDHHAFEGSWKWRWNGKLVSGRKVAA